jgi:hypothetical protein
LKGVNDVAAFLQNVADEILTTIQHHTHPARKPAVHKAIRVPTWEQYQQNYPYYFKRVFLRDVQTVLGERKLLWLIDEFQGLDEMVTSDTLPTSFLEFLRNLMQFGSQMAFIFAGTREITEQYWSVFFNIAVHRKIGVLKDRDATRLITAPVRPSGVRHDRFAVPLIRQQTGNHPYFLQLLCDRIIAELNVRQQTLVNAQIIESAVDDLVLNGTSNLKFYWLEVMNNHEQAIASTVQEILRRRAPADISTIWSELQTFNPRVTPEDVARTLHSLVEKDLLEKDRTALDTYRFTIGLVERFIGAHISYTEQSFAKLW